ncbi:unnamed protein product [Lupinus luteus]|uniref:Uncharacterized protein n=1 Tax=Lupinus luteus TaxID=3873 RepID=A0AAV1XBR4_LUPLU
MKSGFSSVWPSVVRLRLKDKSATPFCIFSKVKSASNNPRSAPVYLNVYDLTTARRDPTLFGSNHDWIVSGER